MGNDFWSVIESIVAAFLILDIDDKALPYIKSRVLARARGGRRRLVLSKIKKSVNLIKVANMFKPQIEKNRKLALVPKDELWAAAADKNEVSKPKRALSGGAADEMMRSKDDSVLCVNGSSPPLLSRCNSDGAPMMHQQGRKSFDAADLDQLSAELGLIGTSGLEKEAQLRTAHLSWPRDDVSSQAVCSVAFDVSMFSDRLLVITGSLASAHYQRSR
jgi:hypothetical protein